MLYISLTRKTSSRSACVWKGSAETQVGWRKTLIWIQTFRYLQVHCIAYAMRRITKFFNVLVIFRSRTLAPVWSSATFGHNRMSADFFHPTTTIWTSVAIPLCGCFHRDCAEQHMIHSLASAHGLRHQLLYIAPWLAAKFTYGIQGV